MYSLVSACPTGENRCAICGNKFPWAEWLYVVFSRVTTSSSASSFYRGKRKRKEKSLFYMSSQELGYKGGKEEGGGGGEGDETSCNTCRLCIEKPTQ